MLQTVLASLLINGVVVGAVAGVLCLLLPRFGRLLASRRAAIWLVMAALLFIPFGLPARSAPLRVTLPESPVAFSVPAAPRQAPAWDIDLFTALGVRHRDIAKKLLLLIARCLHWFNPLIWMLEKRADKDIELACDERVLRGKTRNYRLAYGALLVESAKAARKAPCPALSTAFDSGKKSLMERLRNMVRGETRYKGTLEAALITLALLMALSLVVVIPVTSRADTPGGGSSNPATGGGDTSSSGPSQAQPGGDPSGDPAYEMPHTPLTGDAPEPTTLPFEPDNPSEAVSVDEPPVPPTHALAGDAGFLSAVRLAYPDEPGSRYLEIYRSFDGGATWEQTPVDTSQHFSQAFVIHHGYTSRENGYIVVGGFKYNSRNMGSYVYRTTDGGESWEIVRFVIGEPDDILFINHETLLISARVGGLPRLMMTEDGGKSWREQDLTPLMLEALDIDGEKFDGYFTHLSSGAEDGLRLSYRLGGTGPAVTVYSKDGAGWTVESIV